MDNCLEVEKTVESWMLYMKEQKQGIEPHIFQVLLTLKRIFNKDEDVNSNWFNEQNNAKC